MPKKQKFKKDDLSRLLIYILGHRPDEFGLVPEENGFITIKDITRALNEEPGWGYVRQGHIKEVLMGKDRPLFELDDDRLRVLDKRWTIDLISLESSLPKILYIAAKRKAYPHILEKGLRPAPFKHLVLSVDKEMALRIGKRKDHKPILLEIQTYKARMEGVLFYSFNELFLADKIPARFISGPPVVKIPIKKPEEEKSEGRPLPDFQAGTFILNTLGGPGTAQGTKGKKQKGWKESAKKLRRRKG